MAIEDGHADAMMTSYNAWNKVPMGANPVLRDVVMKQWGFDGIICTDAGALGNMVRAHHAYATMPEAAAAAIHAGINQFLENATKPVQDALTQGLIKESDIDRNLRGVFRVMIRLGMLDPHSNEPYAHIGFDSPTGSVDDPWLWAKNKALARKVTDESIVLLKNEGNLLPAQGHNSQAHRRDRASGGQGCARLVQRNAAVCHHTFGWDSRSRRKRRRGYIFGWHRLRSGRRSWPAKSMLP